MKSLRILKILLGESRAAMALMATTGVISGLCSIGLIAVITRALHAHDGNRWVLLSAFLGLLAGKILSGIASQVLLTRFSQGTILDLSINLCRRIVRAPLRTVEREGSGSLLTVMTDDVSTVTWALQCIPTLATNLAVVLGCGIYLFWLSPPLFLAAGVAVVIGAILFKVLNDRAVRWIVKARESRAVLLGLFGSLVTGIKEMMLNRARRDDFIDRSLADAARQYRDTNVRATTRHVFAEAWVQVLLYSLIGGLLFASHFIAPQPPETLTAYAFAVLYMMGPLWSIMGAIPAVLRGQVALDKIESLGLRLDQAVPDEQAEAPAAATGGAQVVSLRAVEYVHVSPDPASPEAFRIGPVDFTLRAGEIVMLVGGNGSGKTTLAKVLTGLYAPSAGTIRVDDVEITDANRDLHRDRFAAVFADFHLFDELHGVPAPALAAVPAHLETLRLAGKVGLEDGRFSTTRLSQGQRKRLALLVALLEDRPFYVFDEWAADQDPEYKAIFYGTLLPALRSRGKGVVVITHDDRYFGAGDRVVRLDEGKLVPVHA